METPRLFFDGPIIKNKLNFSEAVTYDVVKSPCLRPRVAPQ